MQPVKDIDNIDKAKENEIRAEKIEFLSEYKNITREYKHLTERYDGMYAKKDGVKAQTITDMPMAPAKIENKMDTGLCEQERLKNIIQNRMDKLFNKQLEIEEAIQGVEESILRTILSLRYIDGLNWENIAVMMSYSWKQIHRLHNEALTKIGEKKKMTLNDTL